MKLATNLPDYVHDLNKTIEDNKQIRKLPSLADIGAGLVSSIFALVTIPAMSMFTVSRGKTWRDAALSFGPPHQAERIRRATDRIAAAVGSYVGGALAQASIAGAAAFLMLVILGVPSPLPLAVIIALLDLIPLVGATLGAVIVGVVTLFNDFPKATIIWAIFAIVYQQFEYYAVQPRIQSRAVALDRSSW